MGEIFGFDKGELFGFCGRNIWIFVKENYLDFIIIDFERNTPPRLVVLRTRRPKEREVYLRIPPRHYEEYTRYMRQCHNAYLYICVGWPPHNFGPLLASSPSGLHSYCVWRRPTLQGALGFQSSTYIHQ